MGETMGVMKINCKKPVFVFFALILPIGSVSLSLYRAKTACLNCLIRTFKTVERSFIWTGGFAVFNNLTIDGNAMMYWRKACHAILNKARASGQKNMRKQAFRNLRNQIKA